MTSIRLFYFCMGWVFFATGVVGAFLPVLPTTVFMILSLWMFSKSSARFHDWLYSHKHFGPPLQRWHQYRVIPLSAKITAVSMMSVSLMIVVFISQIPWWASVLTALLMLFAAVYILSKPSKIPHQTVAIEPAASK